VLRVTSIAHAKLCEVRSAAVGEGNTPGSWQAAGKETSTQLFGEKDMTYETKINLELKSNESGEL